MAYNFDATLAQFLSVNDNASLDVTGAITLFGRNRRTATAQANNSGVLGKWTTTGNQRSYALNLATSNFVQFGVSSDGTFQAGNFAIDTTGPTSQDVWVDFTGRFIPSTSVSAWIGSTKEVELTSSIAASIYSGSSSLWIGSTVGVAGSVYFPGDICDCAIWSTDLSDAEIASLAKGFKPTRIRPQSLVFYAPLIRNLQDTRGGLTITNNNTATVAVHPRVY